MAWKTRGRIYIHAESVELMNELINSLDKKEKKLFGLDKKKYNGDSAIFVKDELYDIGGEEFSTITKKIWNRPSTKFILIADYAHKETIYVSKYTHCIIAIGNGYFMHTETFSDTDYKKRNDIGFKIPITDVVNWINATEIPLWSRELEFLDAWGYTGVKNGIRKEELKKAINVSTTLFGYMLPMIIAFVGFLSMGTIWGILLLVLSLFLGMKNRNCDKKLERSITIFGLVISVLGISIWLVTSSLNLIIKLFV